MAEESNAVNPGGVVQGQPASGNPTQLRIAANAGIPIAGNIGDGQQDRTMDAIYKLAGGVLDPLIEQNSQEQYFEGVQRAAAGEAVKDIVKDQPAITQIFGPSAAVVGARTYAKQKAISEFGARMAEQMPKLAEQGPEALTRAASDTMNSLRTGDKMVDGALSLAMADQLAPLYKQHATQHYTYNQKLAKREQMGTWAGDMDAYEAQAKAAASPDGGVSAADKEALGANLLGRIVPFGDQTDDSYEDSIKQTLVTQARKGNFHVIDLMKRTGILGALDQDSQAQLEGVFKAAGGQALQKLYQTNPELAFKAATIARDHKQNPRLIPGKMAELNAEAARISGVPIEYAQLMPWAQADNLVGQVMTAQLNEQQTAAKKQQTIIDKEVEEQSKRAYAVSQFMFPGAIDTAVATGQLNSEQVENAMGSVLQTRPQPEQLARILANSPERKFKTAATLISNLMANPQDTPGVQTVARIYDSLRTQAPENASSIIGSYFSEKQADLVERYLDYTRQGAAPEAAWASAQVLSTAGKDQLPSSAKTEMHKAIRAVVEKENETWYNRNLVTDQTLRTIEAMTNAAARTGGSFGDTKHTAMEAYGRAKARGLQVFGQHAVLGSATDPSLLEWFGHAKDNAGPEASADAFNDVLTEGAKSLGLTLDSYVIMRRQMADGTPRFLVQLQAGERIQNFSFTGADVLARAKKKAETPKVGPITSTGAGRGAATTMSAGPGALSIPSPFQ